MNPPPKDNDKPEKPSAMLEVSNHETSDNDDGSTASLNPAAAATFPQKLIELLEDPMCEGVMEWKSHGKAFSILDKTKLEEEVLPTFFKQKCRFFSFTRKLNRWNFRRITQGDDAGAFFHKFFQRKNYRLCLQMTCQKYKRVKKSTLPPFLASSVQNHLARQNAVVAASSDKTRQALGLALSMSIPGLPTTTPRAPQGSSILATKRAMASMQLRKLLDQESQRMQVLEHLQQSARSRKEELLRLALGRQNEEQSLRARLFGGIPSVTTSMNRDLGGALGVYERLKAADELLLGKRDELSARGASNTRSFQGLY